MGNHPTLFYLPMQLTTTRKHRFGGDYPHYRGDYISYFLFLSFELIAEGGKNKRKIENEVLVLGMARQGSLSRLVYLTESPLGLLLSFVNNASKPRSQLVNSARSGIRIHAYMHPCIHTMLSACCLLFPCLDNGGNLLEC